MGIVFIIGNVIRNDKKTTSIFKGCHAMRNPNEIEINGKKLSDIIALHEKYCNGNTDGKRADLTGTYLTGAYLTGAYLTGANLTGANDIVAIGPIGSRGDFIFSVKHEKSIMVKTGCFWGTLAEFKSAVKKTHNENEYSQSYAAAIVFIRKYFAVKK
jgi:hypothetical protein